MPIKLAFVDITGAGSVPFDGANEVPVHDVGASTNGKNLASQFGGTGGGDKALTIYAVAYGTDLAVGDGVAYWLVPADLDAFNLESVSARVGEAMSTGSEPTIQIAKISEGTPGGTETVVDMLSTPITIDANERHSKDATTPAVINPANQEIQFGDLLRIDVDVAGTGTKGLFVTIGLGN